MSPWNTFVEPPTLHMNLFEGWIKEPTRTSNPKVKIVHKDSIEESREDEWLRQLHDGWARSSK